MIISGHGRSLAVSTRLDATYVGQPGSGDALEEVFVKEWMVANVWNICPFNRGYFNNHSRQCWFSSWQSSFFMLEFQQDEPLACSLLSFERVDTASVTFLRYCSFSIHSFLASLVARCCEDLPSCEGPACKKNYWRRKGVPLKPFKTSHAAVIFLGISAVQSNIPSQGWTKPTPFQKL